MRLTIPRTGPYLLIGQVNYFADKKTQLTLTPSINSIATCWSGYFNNIIAVRSLQAGETVTLSIRVSENVTWYIDGRLTSLYAIPMLGSL